jgi:SHAQKYF class myb-like DNA-binding protein
MRRDFLGSFQEWLLMEFCILLDTFRCIILRYNIMNKIEENSGRWTPREQALFVEGLKKFGRAWKKISTLIGSRSPDQVRSHAQKHDLKLRSKNFSSYTERRNVIKIDSATQYGEGVFIPGFN